MIYIDAVKYKEDLHGCRVIEKLRYANELTKTGTDICTKQQLIQYIKTNTYGAKTKYRKSIYDDWTEGAYIRVVDDSYLRTDSNFIREDNLSELPEF